MPEFNIKLADEVYRIRCRYEHIRTFFKDYWTDEPAERTLFATEEDIDRAREITALTERNRGEQPQEHSEGLMERRALHELLARDLLTRGVLLVHGSAVVADGQAVVFIAPTQTGKSTQTRFWKELLGDRAEIINDDKQLLRPTANGVMSYISPWGMVKHPAFDRAPVKAIVRLQRGDKDRIRSMTKIEMLPDLMKASLRGKNAAETTAILTLEQSILSSVELYALQCTPTQASAKVAHEAIF